MVRQGKMQISDREIQNTLDLLKRQRSMQEEQPAVLTEEEVAGVRAVARQIAESPEVRQERVEKLKTALESSSYMVTGDDVAKKLIGRIITDKIR